MGVGAMVGVNREHMHKPAGFRTHVLVALGAAVFALGGEMAGMGVADVSRIIQGIAVGVGSSARARFSSHRRISTCTA
jgi:putative Mg2+ transporter-C (MgtC) family protein